MIATIVTDKDLKILAEGPAIAIHQPCKRSRAWTSGISASTAHLG